LRPESVRAVIEVKGFLTNSNVVSCIEKYVSLGKLWKEYTDRYNEYREKKYKLHSLGLFLMGWNVRVNTNGQPMCTGESLRKKIVSTYRNELTKEELVSRHIPMLN